MKKNKIAIVNFMASILFLFGATINFLNSRIGIGIINIVLVANFLYLGIRNLKDCKEHKNEKTI